MKIIGIVGPRNSGKNTVATLIREFKPNFTEKALADKLKNECSKIFNVPRHYFDDRTLKESRYNRPLVISKVEVSKLCEAYNVFPIADELNCFNINGTRIVETPRQLLQICGTDILRSIDINVHCKGLNRELTQDTLITDIRFNNEFTFFRNNFRDAVFIYVNRPHAEELAKNSNHVSETEVLTLKEHCDIILYNGLDLDSLKTRVETICANL